MGAKLTRLTHKIAIQLHLLAESCTICSFRSRRPVQKVLDTSSYTYVKKKRHGQFHACAALSLLCSQSKTRMHVSVRIIYPSN
jgi:hypothetical protein